MTWMEAVQRTHNCIPYWGHKHNIDIMHKSIGSMFQVLPEARHLCDMDGRAYNLHCAIENSLFGNRTWWMR
jgi:hypothetical protein